MLPHQVLAAAVNIEVMPSFGMGDNIVFNYTLSSNTSESIKFIPSVECPNAPYSLLSIESAELKPGVSLTRSYSYINVTPEIMSQTCAARVSILSPYYTTGFRNFSINTHRGFSFKIRLCRDPACGNESRVFLVSETVYFGFESSADNISITANITPQGGAASIVTVPGHMRADAVGAYTIEAAASRSGYKTVIAEEQFAVIEENAAVERVSASLPEPQPGHVPLEPSSDLYSGSGGSGYPSSGMRADGSHTAFLLSAAVVVIIAVVVVTLAYLGFLRRKHSSDKPARSIYLLRLNTHT
jgi:hypothetical protein